MAKVGHVAVQLSVAEWKVLSNILDEAAERMAMNRPVFPDSLTRGLSENEIPTIQRLASLGASGTDPAEAEPQVQETQEVSDFLVVAGVHKRIKDQVGLEDD